MHCIIITHSTTSAETVERLCWRGGKHSVYCNAVCLFSSRFPGWLIADLVIFNFILLAHSVVDLHPGVMETKQEQQNVTWHSLWYEEWITNTKMPLVFDICSTITCDGKGELYSAALRWMFRSPDEWACSLWAARSAALSLHLSSTAFLTFTGVE